MFKDLCFESKYTTNKHSKKFVWWSGRQLRVVMSPDCMKYDRDEKFDVTYSFYRY